MDTSGTHPRVVKHVVKGYSLSDIIRGKYIACLYDQQWWIGNICALSEEQQDVQVQFMHPHGPAEPYCWATTQDVF